MTSNYAWMGFFSFLAAAAVTLILGSVWVTNYYTLQEDKILAEMVAKGADPILAMCATHNRLGSDSMCLARVAQGH